MLSSKMCLDMLFLGSTLKLNVLLCLELVLQFLWLVCTSMLVFCIGQAEQKCKHFSRRVKYGRLFWVLIEITRPAKLELGLSLPILI